MTRKVLYGGAAAVLSLVLVFTVFSGGSGGSPGLAKKKPLADAISPPSIAAQAEAVTGAAPERSGGLGEGIKVHGHWTIEVQNPDGTLASHTEFENAVTPDGKNILGAFLARNLTVGLWAVSLDGGPNSACFNSANNFIVPCLIVEAAYSGSVPTYMSKTLAVVGVPGGLVLSGTAVAAQDGQVGSVTTRLNTCANTQAPGALTTACTNEFADTLFTGTTLASPIAVSTGQQIQVTVNISFS